MRTRRAFSFLEILIGVAILVVGLLPLLYSLSSGTQGVRLTLKQVQASNHASNLLEALRATPFKDLALFPPCMAQLRGGDNVWRTPAECADVDFILPEVVNAPKSRVADDRFQKFKEAFCSESDPIIPPLDSNFTRYFVICKYPPDNPSFITLITRVEWYTANVLSKPGAKPKLRKVELRTTISDPYFCTTN